MREGEHGRERKRTGDYEREVWRKEWGKKQMEEKRKK